MRALDTKGMRDLWHLRGQMVAIAVVVACGVAVVVTMRVGYDSLVLSRDTYYARYRFADVFAGLKRAPEALRSRIEALSGVDVVDTRVVAQVTLDVPGLPEPATGRLISLPERGEPRLNALHLRRGRFPEPGRADEVVVSEAFATANGLDLGGRIGAVLNGRWQPFRIVGVALSPEYVLEIMPGSMFPDNRRFGVIWLSRKVLGPAFDLDGAFNDVALTLVPGASEAEVIAGLDDLLRPFGGLGAFARRHQVSNQFLSDEIKQNQVFGRVVPLMFLGVAAFLLHIVLARLVSTQRDQIAVLKAFGYRDLTVGLHYLKLAGVAVAVGALGGTGLGLWLGSQVNRMYQQVYHFPLLAYDPGLAVIVLAIAVSGLAALAGALTAVRRVLSLPPAEAMRPEPPARFGAGLIERTRAAARLPASVRMIWRNLARRPVRAGLSVLGMAMAVSILIVGRFFVDAIDMLAQVQFRTVQREDVTVSFHEPRPARARFELAGLEGVMAAEPFRSVPARLRHDHHSRRIALFGLEPGAELRRVVGRDLRARTLPPDGVILTDKLAEILHVAPGDRLRVEVLEGARPVRSLAVAGTVDELLGVSAYMRADALHRLMREGPTVSGAFLRIDADAASAVNATLKRMPAVAGSTSRTVMLQSFDETLAESMGVFIVMLVGFASVIAVAMVYNAARIALSERGRELASLRVLGFTRAEISVLLLGEQALLTLVAIPLGYAIGGWLAYLMSEQYQWELFRMPLVISERSYAFAFLVVAGAAVVSALVVRRRLDRLDLVEVLKTRE